MSTPRQTPKSRRESKLLAELSDEHGYRVVEMTKPAERYTYLCNLRTGKGCTMRVIKLVVPTSSFLAVAMDATAKKKARRR